MDLRNFNYKLPQLLTRLRALFRRDQDWINVAFQRSVILTRRDQPRQFALSRIDFFRHTDKIPDESESRYKQIRFIAERLSPPRIIARLNRLGDLKFTAAKSNFVLNQTPGFSDDYRPRDNEYSNWPGT